MTDHARSRVAPGEDLASANPAADEESPALMDAEETFVILLLGAALFVGAVYVFIL